ncbi:MAG: tetratricopeptide repeat protein, partial [Alphaproteobacteria bacterium]
MTSCPPTTIALRVLAFALMLALAAAMPARADSASDLGDGAAAYTRGDFANALKKFKPLAEEGHAIAQFVLGAMYANGRGVPRDPAEAVKWYRKAAEQGHADAQYNLSLMYRSGEGVTKDDTQAANWTRKAAEQGPAKAQYNLGVMYAKGLGVKQDYKLSVKWARKAAEQGDALAQLHLGTMYANSLGVAKDTVQAHMWFDLAASRLPPGKHHDTAILRRDTTARSMTPEQIEKAEKLKEDWEPGRRKPAPSPREEP